MKKNLIFLLCALFIALPFGQGFALTKATALKGSTVITMDWNQMHHYRTYEALLKNLAVQYPKIANIYSIGHSWLERQLWCIQLTGSARDIKNKTGIAVFGNIHGGEQQSGESALYTANYLATNYDVSSEVKNLLDNYIIYIIPLINPDGYEQSFIYNTRQNMRPTDRNGDGKPFGDPYTDTNGDGVIATVYKGASDSTIDARTKIGMESPDFDMNGKFGDDPRGSTIDMNRTFDYMWNRLDVDIKPVLGANSWASAGPGPASEPEVEAVQNFLISHPVNALVTLHTGEQSVLYPWCYTPDPPADVEFMKKVSEDMVKAYENKTGRKAYAMQSYDDYPTNAELIDWAYGRLGIHAYTMEVYAGGKPANNGNPAEDCRWGNELPADKWIFMGDWMGQHNIWFRNTASAQLTGKPVPDQGILVDGVKDSIITMIRSEPYGSGPLVPEYLRWGSQP